MELKKAMMSFAILILLASCSSSLSTTAIDPAQLQISVNKINSRLEGVENDYYNYIQRVDKKYQDNYLSSDCKQEISPSGYPINSSLIETEYVPSDANAVVAMKQTSITYQTSDFTSAKFGRYRLEVEYFIPSTFASSALVKVEIDGASPFNEANTILLPLQFEDNISTLPNGNKNFDSYTSKYGDQMSPRQKRILSWQKEGIYESQYTTSQPLVFELSSINPTITITNLSDDYFYIGKITLIPVTNQLSYSEYYQQQESKSQGNDNIELNAIEYTSKNTNDVTVANEQSPSVTPYDYNRKLLNVTSGWDQSGQEISWDLNVESAGFYPLTFHYYNDNDNFPLFRKIEINGEVPFKEVVNYSFPTTGPYYANHVVSDKDGNPYYFYLKSGHNTISVTATIEPLLEVYNNLMAVYDDINDFSIQIRKITGATIDQNKEYELVQYFPETLSVLKAYKNIIIDSYNKLYDFVGNDKSSSVLSYFQRMKEIIDELIDEPNDLPLKLNLFSSGDNCLAKLVADTANTLQNTNMVLDTIYVTNDSSKIRPSNSSFFSSFYSSLVTLGQTFTSDKYKTILNDGELNIWSARSQAYNDILQTYADNEFTPNTKCEEFPNGIKVNIRQMPSEDNLIYAYAANTVPDLVLGINSGRAFEFALRGDAAYPLSDFDDTWKYKNNYWGFTPYYFDVVDNMPRGQLMSMLYNDKFYSLPESTSAELMFSRDDIMNVMGDKGEALPIPQTWEEVVGILSRLQSAGRNFYYSASASGSLKSLSATAQFILQNNGSILSSDAFTTDLRNQNTYEGIKLLTDLYTIYALPTEVGSFYNHFRYGTYPLGIGDVGMYLQLKYVAPELLGKWSVHQIPGIKQEVLQDGTYKDLNHDGEEDEISRWYISNGSSAMIFNNSKMIDEAWLFLQWWMSTSVQEAFTEALQSTFGPSVVWFSANLDAAQSLPIDSEVRKVVLKQVKWIIDLQQIPGQYMLQRGLSDIWNTVVFGTSSSGNSTGKLTVGEAIDLQKVIIDREIQRKMDEFGYYDSKNGVANREYILRNFDWIEACQENFKNNVNGGNASTSSCPI